MLTVTTLASGSSGNAALVSCGSTHILLDAGISARRITNGIRAAGVDPEKLTAIFVTHEHHDHISGLQVLSKKLRVPIVATDPTCGQIAEKAPNTVDLLRSQRAGSALQVGSLCVRSFPTPHDAAGSVGYSVAGDGCRMVVCTDLGHVTPDVERAVKGCDLLLCEANHDEEWVRSGPYPLYLKQRILGELGHLSNEAGGRLAAWAVERGTRTVVLAHLSSENNTPRHAYEAVCREMRACGIDPELDVSLSVAPRKESGPTFRLARDRAPMYFSEQEAVFC